MESPRVILVMLRQPGRDHRESRTDPLWEFGSFGCTGCHRRNLMHPGRITEVHGARLGFAQGGPLGIRLVLLTPPVRAVEHPGGAELRWRPARMPFRYERAPILAANDDESDFPALARLLRSVNRPTPVSRFASRFRTCRTPLPSAVGREVVRRYDSRRDGAGRPDLASSYEQALPWPPPCVDNSRQQTYHRLLSDLGARAPGVGRGRSC